MKINYRGMVVVMVVVAVVVAVVVEVENVAAGTRAWVTSGRDACRMDGAGAVQVGGRGHDAQA